MYKRQKTMRCFIDIAVLAREVMSLLNKQEAFALCFLNRHFRNALLAGIFQTFPVEIKDLECFAQLPKVHIENISYLSIRRLSCPPCCRGGWNNCIESQVLKLTRLKTLNFAIDAPLTGHCSSFSTLCSLQSLSINECRAVLSLPPHLLSLTIIRSVIDFLPTLPTSLTELTLGASISLDHFVLPPNLKSLQFSTDRNPYAAFPDSLLNLTLNACMPTSNSHFELQLPNCMEHVQLASFGETVTMNTSLSSCLYLNIFSSRVQMKSLPPFLCYLEMHQLDSSQFKVLPRTLQFIRLHHFNELFLTSDDLPDNLQGIFFPTFRGVIVSLPSKLCFLAMNHFAGEFSPVFRFPKTLISIHFPHVNRLELPPTLQFLSVGWVNAKVLPNLNDLIFLQLPRFFPPRVQDISGALGVKYTFARGKFSDVWMKEDLDPDIIRFVTGETISTKQLKKICALKKWR